jgi:acyl-CoA thioesterase FadM
MIRTEFLKRAFFFFDSKQNFIRTLTAIVVDSQIKFKKPKSLAQRLAITRPEIVVPAF